MWICINMHKIVFLGNLPLPHVTSYGFLASCQNLEKTNDTIPRKCLDRGKDRPKDGQKDKQTLFHRTLPPPPGPTRTVHAIKEWQDIFLKTGNLKRITHGRNFFSKWNNLGKAQRSSLNWDSLRAMLGASRKWTKKKKSKHKSCLEET